MNGLNQIQWNFVAPGLILGLFGWLCYWAGSVVIGAVVGGGALGMLGFLISGIFPHPSDTASMIAGGVGVVLGVIAGVMFMRTMLLYFFFVAGASLGGTLVWKFLGSASSGSAAGAAAGVVPGTETMGWVPLLAIIVGAAIGGFALVKLRRFIIAVVTSVVGAMLLQQGAPPAWNPQAVWLISLVIFLIVQAGLVHRFVDRESFDRRSGHPRYRRESVDED